MSDEQPRKRGTVLLLIMAVVIVLLLIAEGILVTVVSVSPGASEALSERVEGLKRAWEGEDGEPGIPDRFKASMRDFYDNQIRPLWAMPEPDSVEPTFAKCRACHEDFESKVRFTHVYMDHPVHEQAGVSCAVCHTQVAHPNPLRPSEATCQSCHEEEVTQKGKCDMCHPPGSLPHFFLLGAPRDRSIECTTCHTEATFTDRKGERLVRPALYGQDPAKCLSCHQDSWCTNCHTKKRDEDGVPVSPHPDSWSRSHGPIGDLSTVECARCHFTVTTWCFYRCHGQTQWTSYPKQPMPKERLLP